MPFSKVIIVILLTSFLVIQPAFAASFEDFSGLKKIAGENAAGYNTAKINLPVTIGTIIQYVLSFLGIIMLCIVLISYFIMSGAGGDEAKVKSSKAWIKNGIIGILIIMAAYLLSAVIIAFVAADVYK
jgi:hypothetical protein